MKTRAHHRHWRSATAALVAVFLAGAAAADIIEFRPQAVTAQLGDPLAVDIFATSLQGEIVSAYDLDVTFDSLVLAATGVTFGSGLGDSSLFEVFDDFDVSVPGLVDLAQLSLLPDELLFSLQGGQEVLLATIFFDTLSVGTSMLDFVFDNVNDVKTFDAAVLPVTGVSGEVTVVSPPVAVSEPPAWALLLCGLAALAVRRRRVGAANRAPSWFPSRRRPRRYGRSRSARRSA